MTELQAGGVEGGDADAAVSIEAPPSPLPTAHVVCPFLIAETGAFRLAAPTRDHRCAAFVPLTSLSLEKQGRLCLTAQHERCATYVASVAARAARAGIGGPEERIGRWGLSRTAPLIEDTGGLLGTLITMIADRRTWPAIPAVLLVATLLAVGISGFRGEGPAAAIATATPHPTAPPSHQPSAATALEPTLGPSPLGTNAGSPSAAPTPAASYLIYTVQSGDTLSTIATKFHTTVTAIQTLNGITDPRKLHVGQKLKIP
jgi:hypothetical protein